MTAQRISVIGAGLAGCAAALAAAERGAAVTLYEQRPSVATPIHQTALPGEMPGAADLGVEETDRAGGLLKAELRILCPALMECADSARTGELTLSVDRARFAGAMVDALDAADGIDLIREQARELPDGPVIVATGPGTWSPLARALHEAAGAGFRFSYIGRPPLVAAESIDLSGARREAPYPRAEPAVFLPLTESEAEALTMRLAEADARPLPGFGPDTVLAEESDPAERLAADPGTGLGRLLQGPRGPDAQTEAPALRLAPDDADDSAVHVEGLLTNLEPEAQVAALRDVQAFAGVRLVRAGMVQRTPWLAGPETTLPNLQLRRTRRVLLAGSLTGAYGYVEAMALGAVAGTNAARMEASPEPLPPPRECLTGALCWALAEHEPHADGRMLRANFGMLPEHRQDQGLEKAQRRELQVARALEAVGRYAGADEA